MGGRRAGVSASPVLVAALPNPPLEGEGRREAAGWGDGLSPRTVPELRDHPTPSRILLRAMRADPESELRSSRPLQGRVKRKPRLLLRPLYIGKTMPHPNDPKLRSFIDVDPA